MHWVESMSLRMTKQCGFSCFKYWLNKFTRHDFNPPKVEGVCVCPHGSVVNSLNITDWLLSCSLNTKSTRWLSAPCSSPNRVPWFKFNEKTDQTVIYMVCWFRKCFQKFLTIMKPMLAGPKTNVYLEIVSHIHLIFNQLNGFFGTHVTRKYNGKDCDHSVVFRPKSILLF